MVENDSTIENAEIGRASHKNLRCGGGMACMAAMRSRDGSIVLRLDGRFDDRCVVVGPWNAA